MLLGLVATCLVGAAGPIRIIVPIRIMALGDSLTAGYGLPHEQSFVPVLQQAIDAAHLSAHVLDAGVSGDTSADARSRLDWVLGDDPLAWPDAAIVELGGNDGLRGLPPGRMEQNIGAVLDTLRARHIPVLLSGMVAPPNMGAAYGQAFRAVFDRLSKRPGLIYDPFFLEGAALHENLEQPDHIHPNAAGVRVIVARLMPDIRRLIDEAQALQAGAFQAGAVHAGSGR